MEILQFAGDSVSVLLAAFAVYHINENTKQCKEHVENMTREHLETIERLVDSVLNGGDK